VQTAGTVPLTSQQLVALAASRLLKNAPRSPGVEDSLMRSQPGLLSRRKLFVALQAQSRGATNPSKAKEVAIQLIQRTAGTIIAGCVSEAERCFGPLFRQFVRVVWLPAMLKHFTDVMVRPIRDALNVAGLSSQQVASLPAASSDSAMMGREIANPPRMPGVSRMMQRAVKTCCLCGSKQGTACVCGLQFCTECLLPLRVNVRKPGKCNCTVIATALQRGIYRPGDKAAVLKRQTLMLSSNRLGQAGRFLVLAELMGVEAVTDTLLGFMVEVIAAQ
jgi:hypothetical protein